HRVITPPNLNCYSSSSDKTKRNNTLHTQKHKRHDELWYSDNKKIILHFSALPHNLQPMIRITLPQILVQSITNLLSHVLFPLVHVWKLWLEFHGLLKSYQNMIFGSKFLVP
ncbi:hypothetical protein PanWU01x14_251200, partial [Parasponia andersonii]